MASTIVGTTLLQTSGAGARIITPHASTLTGDLILVVSSVGSGAITMTPPGGWTTILADTTTGTLSSSIYGFKRLAGDTTYSFAISGAGAFSTHLCITVHGWTGNMADLVIGTGGTRGASGGTFTTTAPTITTATANNLVLCIGTERTTTTEVDITSVNNSFTEYLFVPQQSGSALETVVVAERTVATASAVGATSIVYPNTQANNAIAVQLAIPPGVVTGVAGLAWLSSAETTAMRAGWSVTGATSFRMAVSTASDLSGATFSGTVSASAAGWVTARVTGLTPGTLYYVGLEADGTVIATGRLQGRTMTTSARSYKAVIGSCQFTGSNHAVFDTMRAENADVFIHQGDIHYANTSDPTTWRNAFTSSMTAAKFAQLIATLPMPYTWDNHDWAGQGKSAIDWDNTINPQAFIRELSGDYVGTTEIYRTFVNGRVRFIQNDLWSERSPDTDPETINKRAMSDEQEQWLYATLTAATEPIIVLISQWPLYHAVPGGRWGSYTTQANRIKAWIAARPTIRARMVAIGGDSHSVSADSGANQDALGTIPTLNSSPFNQTGGVPSGTWDIVNFDTLDASGYYSRVTITDTGGSSIAFKWEAVDDASTVVGTFSKTFAASSNAGWPVQIATSGAAISATLWVWNGTALVSPTSVSAAP